MKKLKGIIAAICACLMVSILINTPTYAAYTRKCYLIRNANTTVYSNIGLTNYYGIIYSSDEITVLSVTDRYCRVSYPISTYKTKTGYISTNAILTGTTGNTYTVNAQLTTYRRPNGPVYGYISKGDKVTILGTYGNYTQVKYPVANGYKYGFVTTANANTYIKNSGNGNSGITDGTYKIATALNINYVLDVKNYGTVNGTNVEIYPYHNTNNEKWIVTSVGGGYYRIKDANSGKSLDVYGGGSASGTNVQIWDSNNTNAQKWRFVNAGNGCYYIINANGCYLDVYSGIVKNGNNVWVYAGNQSNAQKWKLTPVSVNQDNYNNGKVNLSYGLYKSNSAHITCGFDGYTDKKNDRHEGIDIKYAIGKPVYSLTDGVITRVAYGRNGRKKNSDLSTIAIYNKTANKTVVYLHSEPLYNLKVGQTISKGQQIAKEAWRGVSSSSGAHTHVEVVNGKVCYAQKSIDDPVLNNQNPTSFWNSQGYNIK